MSEGKHIGYTRVSTILQNDERQLAGVSLDRVFSDQASARDTKRPALKEMLAFIRKGDTVHVHDISRLARNVADLHQLVGKITGKGANLQFEKEGLSFSGEPMSDPMSDLLLSMLGSVYQFERAILLERQREGVQIAKQKGKYKGRKKQIDDSEIRAMLDSGVSFRKTAENLGVSLSSVQRASRAGAA